MSEASSIERLVDRAFVDLELKDVSKEQVANIRKLVINYVSKRLKKGYTLQQVEQALSKYLKEITIVLKSSPDKVDESESRAYSALQQQGETIWYELKEEILELMLSMIGEWGITLFEWEEVLRTALSYLQTKERQYRRLPKLAIERLLDELLPGVHDGRSIVRTLIYQLSRLRNEGYYGKKEDKKVVRDRAVRLVASVLTELAQRYIIPLPKFIMLDDKQKEVPVEKEKKPPSSNVHSEISWFARSVIERKILGKPKENAEFKLENMVTIAPLKRRRKGRTTLSSALDEGIFGPLNIKLPFYRDPKKKLKELEERERKLMERWNRLKRIQQYFMKAPQDEKRKLSLLASIQILAVRPKRRVVNVNLPKECDEIVPLNDVKRVYLETVKKETRKYLRTKLKLPPKYKFDFPEFVYQILKITPKDIDEFMLQSTSTKSPTLLELIKEKCKEGYSSVQTKQITSSSALNFETFEKLLGNDGPLHKLQPVQQLLQIIGDQKLAINDTTDKLRVLYKWVTEGHESEKEILSNKPHFIKTLLDKIVRYAAEGEGKLSEIEEFCYQNRNKNREGTEFILKFVLSLRDTLQYEEYNPQFQELPHERQFVQQQKTLREGAYMFIKMAMEDQFGIPIELEVPPLETPQQLYETQVRNYIEKTKTPLFKFPEEEFQLPEPSTMKPTDGYITSKKRMELWEV